MRSVDSRRPEVVLLAAIVALTVVVVWQTLGGQADRQSGEPAPEPIFVGDVTAIARLQARLRQAPGDADAGAALGLALLQRSRETGDPGLLEQADAAFASALEAEPEHLDALVGRGLLALARHQFAEALTWGERARTAAPLRAAVYGVLVDANVELGRYDQALAAARTMMNIRPGLESYSRVAYLRELHGDPDGAAEAMALAAEAGAPGAESTAWALVQLGNLQLARGDLAAAEAAYGEALLGRPGYVYAEAGIARVLAARGDLEDAAATYEALLNRLPLPEFAIYLGDLYEVLGREGDAVRQRELVRAMQQLSAGAGVDVDLELALFESDHSSDPKLALRNAVAAHARRPSVVATDVLAWAHFRAGDQTAAISLSREALQLGTRDPAMRLRAGLIALTTGDRTAAGAHLALALKGAPALTPLQAATAREAFARLDQ